MDWRRVLVGVVNEALLRMRKMWAGDAVLATTGRGNGPDAAAKPSACQPSTINAVGAVASEASVV